jgi:flagellar assembly factor FliW
MKIESRRFGTMDMDDADEITFPEGLIGFFDEHSFVLVRHKSDSPIGWLQSTKSPWLSLPVVSIESVECDFSYDSLEGAGFTADTHSVMAVLNANGPMGATVNLLAPIVVDVKTREGQQIIALGGEEIPFILRHQVSPQVSTPAPALEAANDADAPPLALVSNG